MAAQDVVRVLICDDSAVMRAILTTLLRQQPDFEVVGVAADPIEARELIKRCRPTVLTLDVEMPKMNGLEFLSRLMRLRPMPVVMVSNHTVAGSEAALQALELGAVDAMSKPRADDASGLGCYAEILCDKLRAAHQARLSRMLRPGARRTGRPGETTDKGTGMLTGLKLGLDRVVALGASTGGTEALRDVLQLLPERFPPIVIVQHMPEMFTASFARRLDSLSKVRVKEAEEGEHLQAGTAYLAPGHSHLSVARDSAGYLCRLARSEPVNRHRPSVDVLFNSVAKTVGPRALGVLMTGMGKDGALGLLAMRRAGAWTIAQDEASCVVYGMPREAALIGAACEVVTLPEIAGHLQQHLVVGV